MRQGPDGGALLRAAALYAGRFTGESVCQPRLLSRKHSAYAERDLTAHAHADANEKAKANADADEKANANTHIYTDTNANTYRQRSATADADAGVPADAEHNCSDAERESLRYARDGHANVSDRHSTDTGNVDAL